MKRLNWLFTLTSLSVLAVTIERFSFTTKILLQPYDFLRLHELFQMSVLILATVLIPFCILHVLSDNFKLLQNKRGLWLATFFIIGIYFYSTGNGLHEVASHLFNTFCPVGNPSGPIPIGDTTACKAMFFNDYYTGNILYFIGAFLMVVPLVLLEIRNPTQNFNKKDTIILIINACVYALAIFAYAAFDRVLVGFWYGVITMLVVDFLYLTAKKAPHKIPFTFYSAITLTLGTLASLLVRLR